MTEERQDGGHELVVLIDPQDREIGQMEKLAAHREGRLHRAFSVFVFNAKGELLLQQRQLAGCLPRLPLQAFGRIHVAATLVPVKHL